MNTSTDVPTKPKVLGVWFVGARGSIATMTMLCARLLSRATIEPIGLITERQPYASLPFCPLDALHFGGCDIRDEPLSATLDVFLSDRTLPPSLYAEAKSTLSDIDSAIVDLSKSFGCAPAEALSSLCSPVLLDGLRSSIAKFKATLGDARTIVVNVGSTEEVSPLADRLASCAKWEDLKQLIEKADCQLPWGVLHACAALLEDCAYVNFTPNIGTELPALVDLAKRRHLPHAGKDGKTGETLLKTALAPMFEARALRVSSWTGYNILGNSDGQSLSNAAARDAKLRSKDQQLRSILHDTPDICTRVGIDYVPSLGDWKTAWDFVHFEGILGTKMSLHLLWQGADTILAAPLVMDLIRLTEFAWRRGEAGALRHLNAFFKTPTQCASHDFWYQMAELRRHLGIDASNSE